MISDNTNKLAYSRKEIKAILRIGNSTVQRLLTRDVDPIPHFRIGKKIIIPADLFNKWVAAQPDHINNQE